MVNPENFGKIWVFPKDQKVYAKLQIVPKNAPRPSQTPKSGISCIWREIE